MGSRESKDSTTDKGYLTIKHSTYVAEIFYVEGKRST